MTVVGCIANTHSLYIEHILFKTGCDRDKAQEQSQTIIILYLHTFAMSFHKSLQHKSRTRSFAEIRNWYKGYSQWKYVNLARPILICKSLP